jgi:dihydrofolate reductase
MEIILIAAMSLNRVIGRNNTIPWKIPGEQKMFREFTFGHTVIAGRKTFESIGHPLEHRRNIIVTSNPAYSLLGCEVACNIASAIEMCSGDKVFIIGGQKIYEQCLSFADKLYLTVLHREVEGDTFFPPIPENDFYVESSRFFKGTEPFTFYCYCRK